MRGVGVEKTPTHLSDLELDTLSIRPGEPLSISLKYYDPKHECLSAWQAADLRAFSSTVEKLRAQTWIQVLQSGGRSGQKVGLGCTKHRDSRRLPRFRWADKISRDLDFYELRVTERARIHGFNVGAVFFVTWLDRNHQIYPM